MFQSPSLRGSGRFLETQSTILKIVGEVSIPFIAGQWSLPRHRTNRGFTSSRVSIPFIAGQWSLLHPPSSARTSPRSCFNPLHCGAVVASTRKRKRKRRKESVSIPFIAGQWSLHATQAPRRTAGQVSIPFIAGQWSLQLEALARNRADAEFQSPSLRGSGRFNDPDLSGVRLALAFQSPSLRGSGRFRSLPSEVDATPACFNPLHCGAVVASRS